MSLLSVQDLEVYYEENHGTRTVCQMSFEIQKGESVGIVGASGSGKSSGMLALMGLLPKEARVSCRKLLWDGEDVTPPAGTVQTKKREWKEYEKRMCQMRGKRIAMVFQDPSAYLNPLVKVGKQIMETIRIHKKCSRKEAEDRAMELLEMAGIRNPDRRMKQYPFELSGGMRQRIVIAMALACEPELIIADEPTTALDATVQSQILDLLHKIVEETSTAVLLVSHDMGVIASFCSRVLVMEKGKIVEEGTAEQIFYEPKHPYTQMLVNKSREVMEPTGEKVSEEVILKADNLSRTFREMKGFGKVGYFEAVERVSFEIRRGETLGLVGESGCGKTTLARILTGILNPTEGRFQCSGAIQMVFQDPYASLDPHFSIEEILEEPLLIQKKGNIDERKERIEEMLKLISMNPDDRRKMPCEFSGGQRQRIAIARALMLEPELLICDEPLSALDVSIQSQILELLKKIQKERGLSYLFISHDLDIVRQISHRISVMYLGMIVEMGKTDEIYQDPWHPYTKQLLSAILKPDPRKARRRKKILLKEENHRWNEWEKGCPFAGQCSYTMEHCRNQKPKAYRFGNREVRCFLYSEEHIGKRPSDYQMRSQI